IWKYFTINSVDEAYVNCNTCSLKISRGGKDPRSYGTSALTSHLRRKHTDVFIEYGREMAQSELERARKRSPDDDDSGSQPKLKQPTFFSFIDGKKSFNMNDPRQIKITRLIGEMIALDVQPFSMVTDTGFNQLMNFLEPRYHMPDRTCFSRTVIPDLYDEVAKNLMAELNLANSINFTSDGWTSQNNLNGFLSLTAHWIDQAWQRKSALLSLQSVTERHTADVISTTLSSLMDKWKILSARRGLMLRDNAAAMGKATSLMKIEAQPCFIHTIQLTVNDGLKQQRTVVDCLAVARGMVSHFRHSTSATSALDQFQRDCRVPPGKELRVIQDVPTRWNSSFYMLERLLVLKNALILYAADVESFKCFTPHQWSIAQKIVFTLKPFQEKTIEASSDNCTVGMIIPSVTSLIKFLEKGTDHFRDDVRGVGSMREFMVSCLKRRFSDIEMSKYCVLATLLTPTYKLCCFSETGKKRAERWLVEEALKVSLTSSVKGTVPSSSTSTSTTVELEPAADDDWEAAIWSELTQGYETTSTSSTSTTNISAVKEIIKGEFTKYTSSALEAKTKPPEDPCIWWLQNAPIYPTMALVARKVLASPASSVYSERMFSTAGNIVSDLRSRLDPDLAEKLLFLNKNLPSFKHK
ncbi:unnamed protein product, partial [Lymnaea stagnalis]